MLRSTVLFVFCAVLLVNQFHVTSCWGGGWSNIGGEISRAVNHATQQVHRGVQHVQREVERVGVQIAEVAESGVKEVEKFGKDVGHGIEEGVSGVTGIFKPIEQTVEYEQPPVDDSPQRTKCRPLGGITVDFTCNLAGNTVDCGSPMEVGTVATFTCKPGYKRPEDYVGETSITCNSSLAWSSMIRSCMPDCGKRNIVEDQYANLIDVRMSAHPPRDGESPWHVGIYHAQTSSDVPAQICGGSLITKTLIITAVNCFWNSSTSTKNTNVAQYKAAAGKYYRDWDVTETAEQHRTISEIIVHERYRGRIRVSAYDIAIVRVSEPFTITRSVNLVCLDWRNTPDEARLVAQDDGIVASWSGAGSSNDVNAPVTLSYLPFLTCSDTIPEDQQLYLTSDKMCLKNQGEEDTFVCPHDAGVGYVYPFDTVLGPRYYLRGFAATVLSETAETEKRCDQQKLALFTHFHGYREWVQKIVLGK